MRRSGGRPPFVRLHVEGLKRDGVRHSLRQELGGGWTLRFGPLSAAEVGVALGAFVR